jgi:uncharacterized membrane protein HdeD (DUF308 family)
MRPAVPASPSLGDFLRPLARARWLWILFGVACLALGLVAVFDAGLGFATLSTLFGVFLVVAGLLDAAAGLSDADADPSRRALAVVLAVVGLVGGLICLRHPGDDLYVIVLAGGIYLIVAGALHLASGFDAAWPQVEWALGGAYVVLGVLVLALPALTLGKFAAFFGIAILVRGAAAIVEAIRLRSTMPRWSGVRAPPTHG